MAKYIYEGKHNINLLKYDYTLFDEGDNYYRLNFISKDGDRQVSLDYLLKHDKDLEDENVSLFGPYLHYTIDSIGRMIFSCISYEKDNKDYQFELNKTEKAFFQRLLDRENENLNKDTSISKELKGNEVKEFFENYKTQIKKQNNNQELFTLKTTDNQCVTVTANEIGKAMITGFENNYEGKNDIRDFIEYFLNGCNE